MDVQELESQRQQEMKGMEARMREGSGMNDAEKKSIVMQISAVQTELKQSLDAR